MTRRLASHARPPRRRPGVPALGALLLAALLLDACSRPPSAASPPARAAEPAAAANAAAAAPATADDAPDTRLARITPQAAATVGIRLATAGPAEIAEVLPLYGLIKPDAERTREVIARFPGTVKSVHKAIGDAVRAGETLATIESNESLQTYALTAPIGGIVTAREADPGEQAGSEVLFTIADAGSVWVELGLFPADAARVRSGQRVQIDSVGGDLHGSGRIGLVGVFGGSPTPTARVVLANPDRRWTPGLFVNGRVEIASTTVSVAVQAAALQTLDGQRVVFVPAEGGYAPRAVKTGREDGRAVEILDGLEAGESYVAANSFVVKAELGKAALGDDDSTPDAAAAKP